MAAAARQRCEAITVRGAGDGKKVMRLIEVKDSTSPRDSFPNRSRRRKRRKNVKMSLIARKTVKNGRGERSWGCSSLVDTVLGLGGGKGEGTRGASHEEGKGSEGGGKKIGLTPPVGGANVSI